VSVQTTASSALIVEPGRLPDELPMNLDDVKPPLAWAEPANSERSSPLTLFLTVDVEDTYFDRPILMTGDGIGREYGVFGILDELDAHGLKATFFVNVYEKDRQPPGVVEQVVREIAARGHEVGLHSHPSPALDFYRRPLFRLTQAEQKEVLRWGAEMIAAWTGGLPTSFRAGAYAVNDETFRALEEVGIALDSSCFFASPNNHNQRGAVNAVSMVSRTIEVPVTTVLRDGGGGELLHRKLDIDWLSVEELGAALLSLVCQGATFATFMMHSFSCIEKETRRPSGPSEHRARFVSEVRQDRYVEVYGPKPKAREAISQFCGWLESQPSIRVRTLRDEVQKLRESASRNADVVPIVDGERA
jgi:peptidoglycan/xylan/chitin deacetylase (PgdA/CDA1 family)